MNQYKGKGGNDPPILLKVWSGKHIVIDRVKHKLGEPTHIYSPHMGITGNLPPAMLAAMVSKRGDIGFLDRWLFVYPDRRPKLKSGERGHVSDETIGQWEFLVRATFGAAPWTWLTHRPSHTSYSSPTREGWNTTGCTTSTLTS